MSTTPPPSSSNPPVPLPSSASISGVANALQGSLNAHPLPHAFSSQSIDALLSRQREYVEELGVEAIHQARRADSDFVSASDVDRALEAVRARNSSRRLAWMEASGGIFAGAGVGGFLQVAGEQDPSVLALILATVAMVVGAVLLAVGLTKSRG